jgi:hypothetical protein
MDAVPASSPTGGAPAPTPSVVAPPTAQTPRPPVVTPPPGTAKRSWFRRHPILTVILALIVIGAISSAVSKGNGSGSGTSANNASPAASTPITPPASTSTPPASNMTAAQQQAVESARNYLSTGSGFSRAGLIQQLSSSYGEGFTHAQAVYAANKVGL